MCLGEMTSFLILILVLLLSLFVCFPFFVLHYYSDQYHDTVMKFMKLYSFRVFFLMTYQAGFLKNNG